jgi:D-alanyl-D-alanine carboxypeptidase
MFAQSQTRLFAARSLMLAGWCVFAAVSANVSPVHGHCPDQQDQLAAPHSDPRYPALQQAVDSYFAERQKVEGFTGVSVLVSLSAEKPALHLTSGSTALQDGQPLCPDTLFRIASITKSFTAVLLLQLEAAGVLDIHDPLGKWLPEYPAWSSITIEQLLNMTAQLEGYTDDPAFQRDVVADIHRTFRPEELISYVYPGTNAAKPPWFYSNTNYVLAAMIIAKATGTSYAGALKKRLFEPLRLHDTYYRPRVPPDSVLRQMASGYYFGNPCNEQAPPCEPPPVQALLGQDMKTMNLSSDHGGGGIVASLPDVACWVRALFSDTLLPPRQKTELFSLVSEASGQPIATTSLAEPRGFSLGIGQGWVVSTATPVWFYQGAALGYRVGWFRRPGDDLIVVIGLNSLATGPDNQLSALYATVFGILEPESLVNPGAGSVPHDMVDRDVGERE